MSYFGRLKREVIWIGLFIGSIWLIFMLDQFLPLESLGLRPRKLLGAIGIVTMTFLHGSLSHILSNTFPLLMLLLLLVGSKANSALIIVMITLIGGIMLWLLGSANTIHIGASLLVFGLLGFLLINGFFFERNIITIAISIFILFSYGGSIMAGFSPWQKGVSWDGHLYGFIAGVIVAYLDKKRKSFA